MDEAPNDGIAMVARSYAGGNKDEPDSYADDELSDDPAHLSNGEPSIIDDATETRSYVIESGLDKHLPEHYKLLRPLGSGGMAEVFLAEDTRLGRKVAIKFLKSTLRSDPDLLQRFDLEARAASALNHPNIITIYDIGEAEGVKYIVSEYIDGVSLRTHIRNGQCSVREVVEISIQIASALAAAHNAGVLHRDLKPDNIMLRPDGSVKVVDFGLAKSTRPAISESSVLEAQTLQLLTTSPGLILGTPGYMSPEQCRGTPLDGRTDIFSLGVIIFEMLTGHRPFAGQSAADVIAAIIREEPRRVDDYLVNPPRELVRVVDHSLEKDRERRYESMELVRSDLESFRDQLGPVVTLDHRDHRTIAIGSSQTVSEGRSAYPAYAVAAIIATVSLVIAGWFFLGSKDRPTLSPESLRTIRIDSWNTISAENMTAAAFSPDARTVAFASKQSGSSEIWMKSIEGTGERTQVTRNGFYNDYPVWSPDGREIAYYSRRSGTAGIWRVRSTGGEEQLVVDGIAPGARPVRWSSDTKTIYVQAEGELLAINVASGERKPITHFTSSGVRIQRATLSDDGTEVAVLVQENDSSVIKTGRIAGDSLVEVARSTEQIDDGFVYSKGSVFYSAPADGVVQIFEVSTSNKAPVQLSRGGSDVYIRDVSADGSKVLYANVNESSDLWAVSTDDRKETLVADDVAEEYWPDISPDGKKVAYQVVAQADKPMNGSIFVKPISGGAPVRVSEDGSAPVWSNDGQWLAFFRRTGMKIGLWKARADGSELTKLSDNAINPAYVTTPYLKLRAHDVTWSPDDGMLAYAARTNGNYDIWLASANGTLNRPVSSNKDAKEAYCCAVWTGVGSQLAFMSYGVTGSSKGRRIWVADTANGAVRVLFESKEEYKLLGFAADGKHIVIVRKTDPDDVSSVVSSDVCLVSTETGQERKLISLPNSYFDNFHLARNGQTIAYVTRDKSVTELSTLPVMGGEAQRLVSENDPKTMISTLAWSPDGKIIVFGKQSRTNQLSMLAN